MCPRLREFDILNMHLFVILPTVGLVSGSPFRFDLLTLFLLMLSGPLNLPSLSTSHGYWGLSHRVPVRVPSMERYTLRIGIYRHMKVLKYRGNMKNIWP